MTIRLRRYQLLLCLLSLAPFFAIGQSSYPTALDSAQQFALNLYESSIANSNVLIDGSEYKELVLTHADIGHPYYRSDDWSTGTINYNKQTFYKVDMMYNVLTDRLIIDNPKAHFMLQLVSEKLDGFDLDGHCFRRIIGDSTNKLKTGFYDLLYDGPTKVYVKRRKEIQETLVDRTVSREFQTKDLYFVKTESAFTVIRTKKALYKVFGRRKADVRKRINRLHLRFKNNKDQIFKEAATTFDSSSAL